MIIKDINIHIVNQDGEKVFSFLDIKSYVYNPDSRVLDIEENEEKRFSIVLNTLNYLAEVSKVENFD